MTIHGALLDELRNLPLSDEIILRILYVWSVWNGNKLNIIFHWNKSKPYKLKRFFVISAAMDCFKFIPKFYDEKHKEDGCIPAMSWIYYYINDRYIFDFENSIMILYTDNKLYKNKLDGCLFVQEWCSKN